MKKFLSIALVLVSSISNANQSLTPTAVTSIYDGDTFTVDIGNCPAVLCERISVRINGIDAPEMRGKCAQEKEKARQAKQFLVGKLRSGKVLELRNVARDKYFRLRADVFVDGRNIGKEMLDKSLVRQYAGGKRGGWCGIV
jgi:micrococcal nuclease